MDTKHLFIDSNVWLSLYHFSNNDLEKFLKIKDLIGEQIILYVPIQTRDEVYRNRDAKLKESYDSFSKNDFIKYPSYCKDYPEFEEFNKKYNELKEMHSNWCKNILADISNRTLTADKCIDELFLKTGLIDCDDCIQKAEIRYKKGNPPGKNNKLGDAINWECLLKSVPDGCDLYIISNDKDYKSCVDKESFNGFLKNEWLETKKANVHFYLELTHFLEEHAKDIKLEDEIQKNNLIDKLMFSPNFVTTHNVVSELSKYNGWDENQIRKICYAFIINNQINWISNDPDIYEFYKRIVGEESTELSIGNLVMDKYEELKEKQDPNIK